ncbi:MAG: M1 family aminopeptidase [Bacteroidota bacterium]
MKYLKFLIPCLFLIACGTTKDTSQTSTIEEPEIIEEQVLDTVLVVAEKVEAEPDYSLPVYNPSYSKEVDLIHTKLDLKFDWENQYVIGKAWLTLKPYFYELEELTLDAKVFDFKKINIKGNSAPLKYDYDGMRVTIDLGKKYNRDQEFVLEFDYVAKPNEGPEGGSAAITSDKGLFFINPLGEDKEKPMQIWTQGETENNSRWFPTVDKPNERCTQEITLTVQDKFETLSNGVLVSSTKNTDGTRTDYWKMDLPHAPYLFFIAVGDYAVVKDKWEGLNVDYYVEHEYKPYAREIFNHTPEMLSFFSDITGVKYPWQKYSQVICRDYVSGAMENTTAVIFGDFVQKTDRELIDNSNDFIVAHEMIHHWFGDYVTCESWANLTLNEGFANYGEYLWFEHKYGKDYADHHRVNELNGYLGSAFQQGVHPLIHYSYNDKEDMFDAHSYNKGGLVLHMLRSYIGDDAFFAGFKKYLEDNAFSAVEVDELRMAYEEVTGKDLHWFFDQWFLGAGHPVLKIDKDYNATEGSLQINVEQTQDPEKMVPVFVMPMIVDIYDDAGNPSRHEIVIDKRKQSFNIPMGSEPKLVMFDPDGSLLFEKKYEASKEENEFQYTVAQRYLGRRSAIRGLRGKTEAQATFVNALKDPHWTLRQMGIQNLGLADNADLMNTIKNMAMNDAHSSVRAEAIGKLATTGKPEFASVFESVINSEKAYSVIASALEGLGKLDKNRAMQAAAKLESSDNSNILGSVAEIYTNNAGVEKLPFFESNLDKLGGWPMINFYSSYAKMLAKGDVNTILGKATMLKDWAVNMDGTTPIKRFASTRAISDLIKALGEDKAETANSLKEFITEIKSKETNPQLKNMYNQF